MKKKFFFFVFKHRHRRASFNNFLQIKKVNNFKIYDLSGPIKYFLFGKIIIFLVQNFNNIFKNYVLISCDAEPILLKNAINIWFGGTSHKVSQTNKLLKNNCHVFENFIKKEENLLKLYPQIYSPSYPLKKPKVVFVGDFTIHNYRVVRRIWREEKKNIFNNFEIIEKKYFWQKYNLDKDIDIQTYYIALKDLMRFNLILELSKILKDNFIVVGSKWKPHIKSSLKSNYSTKYIQSLYKGNICIDFGSKWGNNSLYPRSVNIIESEGILLQSKQSDTKIIYHKNFRDMTYNSLTELVKKITILLNDNKKTNELYVNQYKNFKNKNLNYKTLKKIYLISKKN